MSKFLSQLRYGWLSKFWPSLSKYMMVFLGEKVAAYLTYLSIDWGESDYDQTVVCLYRESFIKDIVELRKRTNFNYPVVMAGFTRFQKAWVPEKMQEQTYYQRFEAENEDALKRSDKYVETLIKLISKKVKINAVLSANIDYWQDSGFKRICEKNNIPFLVLSREHPVIPIVCEKVVDRYKKAKYRFKGNGVAVAGDTSKKVLMEGNTIKESSDIKVTGLPRFDAWLDIDIDENSDSRSLVTLLTFSRGYHADQTFKEVLGLFCDASNRPGDYDFIIKTKDEADTAYVTGLLSQLNSCDVRVDHNYSLYDVLPRSKWVVGYNSLSLLEASIAKAGIIIPAWGECKSDGEGVMYEQKNKNVSECLVYSKSPSDFLDALVKDNIEMTQWSDKRVSIFVGEFITLPTKGCSKSFSEFLTKYIR